MHFDVLNKIMILYDSISINLTAPKPCYITKLYALIEIITPNHPTHNRFSMIEYQLPREIMKYSKCLSYPSLLFQPFLNSRI